MASSGENKTQLCYLPGTDKYNQSYNATARSYKPHRDKGRADAVGGIQSFFLLLFYFFPNTEVQLRLRVSGWAPNPHITVTKVFPSLSFLQFDETRGGEEAVHLSLGAISVGKEGKDVILRCCLQLN